MRFDTDTILREGDEVQEASVPSYMQTVIVTGRGALRCEC